MKPRILVLPIAALVIAALVAWRYQRDSGRSDSTVSMTPQQLAPQFELYDQHSRLVKFARYLGRTELLVVFFDGDDNFEEDPLFRRLLRQHDKLEADGIQVVAVSPATPHAIRNAEKRAGRQIPFPVLTDIDLRTPIPTPVHRLWGLADDGGLREGAYYVDRAGLVASDGRFPSPLDDAHSFLDERIGPTPEADAQPEQSAHAPVRRESE